MSYRTLSDDEIVRTLEKLERRVRERFPDTGLAAVSGELLGVARESRHRARNIARPNHWLRAGVALVIAIMLAGLVAAIVALDLPVRAMRLPDFIQVLEAGINDVVLIGAAVFFLATFESRVKRRRALRALHELRSIAHVIDMHQLTKDPGAVTGEVTRTASSPRRTLNRYELKRYLDYCSELLAMTGKLAALYVQRFDDPVALNAVNEVETLTASLSGKVWQKITILQNEELALARRARKPRAAADPQP